MADVPLADGDFSTCSMELLIVGAEVVNFVENVCGSGAKLLIRVEYDSMDGVRWASKVEYLLKSSLSRPQDQRMLKDAVDGPVLSEAGLWGNDSVVDLEYVPISKTWAYSEASGYGPAR